VNICRVEELSLGNRQIAVRHIASNCGTNVESVGTVIPMNNYFSRRWIPEMSTFGREAQHVAVFPQNMHR
jgi:hypothetical protein